MLNSETEAHRPITSPNCVGSSQKWNPATKNSCCTWHKKWQETNSELPQLLVCGAGLVSVVRHVSFLVDLAFLFHASYIVPRDSRGWTYVYRCFPLSLEPEMQR
jgi:hypothetical protein